jgi:HEAT repeat protein
MPLVRKPANHTAAEKPEGDDVLKSLSSPDPERRWAAARNAATLVGADVALGAALRSEPDVRVREAMLTGLARIGTPQAIESIVALLRSDDANLRTGALDALRIMVAQVPELLPRLLSDPDVDVRILCCELARSLESRAAAKLMCNVLDKEAEANVCAAAVDVLAEVGSVEALPSLQNCASRFRESPFLAFAIKVVIDRLSSDSAPSRA